MSHPVSYWGGLTVTNKVIRKLEATTFKQMVESYIHVPVVKNNMTRDEFLAHPDRDKLKDGPYICACTFQPGSDRCDANGDKVVLVIVDLDEAHYARGFVESPASIGEALHPYNFAAYSTAKHTPEEPRLKIMVDVTPVDKKYHRRLARYVTVNLLGMSPKFKGSIETRVLSQPQYRPLQFKGEEFTSILATRTDGIALDVSVLPDEEEDEQAARTYAYDGGDLSATLAYLPIPDLTVEDIREPLMAIDPDCNYKQWTELAASLKHQFRDEDEAEEAYALFNEWSSNGSKYASEEECFSKWQSFRPDTIGKTPVTIRSLFFAAMNAGWDNKKIVASFRETTINWMRSLADDDQDEILKQGAERIAAMPFSDPIVEDMLVQELQKNVLRLTGTRPTKKSIELAVKEVKGRKRAEQQSTEPANWLKPFCFVSPMNKFRNVANGVEMVPDSFNNTFSRHLISEDSGDARPAVLPQHHALNQIKIPVVDGIMYDPRNGGAEPYFTYNGLRLLNTYLPSSLPDEDPENSAAAGALFLKHMGILIQEPEYVDLVVQFLCHVVQHPGEKIRWCPLIQSAPGAGKGFIKDIMQAVIGLGNVKAVASAVIADKWTDWKVGAVLTVLNEIHIPGQYRERVANDLKDYITDPTINVTAKHISTKIEVPNLTNSIAFSNYHDAMFINDGDRRWMPIESPLQEKDQIEALNASGHFIKTAKLIDEWGGALRHWMMNYPIPDSFPVNGPAPDTIYRASVIEESRNPMLAMIENLIRSGRDPLIGNDIIHFAHLTTLCDQVAGNHKNPGIYLKQLGFQPYQRGRVFDIEGVQTAIWIHRRRYDEDLGLAEEVLTDKLLAAGVTL